MPRTVAANSAPQQVGSDSRRQSNALPRRFPPQASSRQRNALLLQALGCKQSPGSPEFSRQFRFLRTRFRRKWWFRRVFRGVRVSHLLRYPSCLADTARSKPPSASSPLQNPLTPGLEHQPAPVVVGVRTWEPAGIPSHTSSEDYPLVSLLRFSVPGGFK